MKEAASAGCGLRGRTGRCDGPRQRTEASPVGFSDGPGDCIRAAAAAAVGAAAALELPAHGLAWPAAALAEVCRLSCVVSKL